MISRPRLLLSAYGYHPDQGSEPTVGWNRSLEATRVADVEVIAHDAGQREAVARAIAAHGVGDRLRVHFLAHTAAEARLMALPGGYYPGYRRWQRRALAFARRRHAEAPFDLTHHASLVGYREPGDLWTLDVPFVWGPVGGTQNTPARYLWDGGLRMALGEGLRSALNHVQLRASPRVRRAAAAAAAVLAANEQVRRELSAALGVEPRVLLETGIREVRAPRRWADRAPGPLRVVWAGETLHRKGLHLALRALRALRAEGTEAELLVLGDGADAGTLAGVPGVDFRGWVTRAQVFEAYREGDVLAFTSLRDTSGNVVLEAMADGLPVVYLDHQGAHDMGSPEAGIPVPVTTPAASVAGLVAGLRALATDPARYDRLSAGAVEQARRFLWTRNGDAVNALYLDLLGRAPEADGGAPTATPEVGVAAP